MRGKVLTPGDGATLHATDGTVRDSGATESDEFSIPEGDRWTLKCVIQLSNSPDLNICDLRFSWSIRTG